MPKNSLTTKSPFFVGRVEQEDRLGLAKSARGWEQDWKREENKWR